MKKKMRWLIPMIFVLLCAAATAGYTFLFVLSDDTTAPEIMIDTEVLEVSVKADDADLLQGVTAFDDVDGDVTANILVEGVSKFWDDNTVTVTYAAFDAAGNVSKASRTLKYTDYEAPVFGLNNTLVLRTGTATDILKYVTAYDTIDGDISRHVKGTLVSDTSSLGYSGVHEVEFRVTNSLGDTQRITLPVEVYESNTYNATVDLGDEYLIYLRRGAAFKPEEYLKELIVGTVSYPLDNQNPPIENLTRDEYELLGDDRELEVRTYINNYVDPEENTDPFVGIANVTIENNVINTIPGQYTVTYTVDYEERYVGYARLNVVVED